MGRIISFRPDLAPVFRDLNLNWLEEYFCVEPHDQNLLQDCEAQIIGKGGYIFFFIEQEMILGTFALIKINPKEFELGKMTVQKAYRGMGIGQKMLSFCLEFSRNKSWDKLVLYSNTSLENSIHLYRKFGFREIPIDDKNPYDRGNIKMEIML
jgi:ribosomal protein S18 acetylase RimI-like enzyme